MCFHITLELFVLALCKMPSYFDRYCFEYIHFLLFGMVTAYIDPFIQKHSTAFHLFVLSSFLSFTSYSFPSTGPLSPELDLSLGIFILFPVDVTMHRVFSLISFG